MHLVGETLDASGVGPLDAALWGLAELNYGSGGRAHSDAECIGYFEAAGFVDVQNVASSPAPSPAVGRKPA